MFEIARGDDGVAVKEISKECQDIGVDISEFLNTLMGKWAEGNYDYVAEWNSWKSTDKNWTIWTSTVSG